MIIVRSYRQYVPLWEGRALGVARRVGMVPSFRACQFCWREDSVNGEQELLGEWNKSLDNI